MKTRRAARLHIDLAALAHNFKQVKRFVPDCNIMPVVKANAYGHGIAEVAGALSEADGYAVAQLDEAIALRELGIDKPITIFQGFTSAAELKKILDYNLRPAISQLWQLSLLQSLNTRITIDSWLKINTGMGRLGLQPDELPEAQRILDGLSLTQPPGLMTHFANADDLEDLSTQHQLNSFKALSQQYGAETSVSNSAGIIRQLYPEQDWVRPGIMLYGSSPLQSESAADLGLKPVMHLSARLIAINHFKQGQPVGYGHRWICPEDMPVGIVNIGYGDGYPRHAEDTAPLFINQQKSQLLGRVSMDSIAVDLRGIEVECGDSVELWGEQLSVDDVAAKASTISYELLCNVGSILS